MLRFATRRTRDFVRLGPRYRMSWRRIWLPYAVKYRPGLRSLPVLWRTPSGHHSPPLKFFGNCGDAIATLNEVSNKTRGASRACFTGVLAPFPLSASSYKFRSGLTATRRLGKQPQRVGSFSTTFLLELVNPIGYRFNHIARRFTCSVCLCFNSRAWFVALFYDTNCFLLRHC